MLPETDPARIRRWCDSFWLKHMWDRAKVETDVASTSVTIVEVRPDWMGGPVPTRFSIARLHYRKATASGRSTGRGRNLKFHEYQPKRPSKNVQSPLGNICDNKDPISLG